MNTEVYYALFHAYPASEPPFNLDLGLANQVVKLAKCEHIPDSINRINDYIASNNLTLSPKFVLLYPIYLEIMDSEHESVMHYIAGIIKDEADKNNWGFDRVGGYTGLTPESFLPVK